MRKVAGYGEVLYGRYLFMSTKFYSRGNQFFLLVVASVFFFAGIAVALESETSASDLQQKAAPTSVSYNEVVNFFPEKLHDHLLGEINKEDCPEGCLECLESATLFMESCQRQYIYLKPSFSKILESLRYPKDLGDLKTFFEKLRVFFEAKSAKSSNNSTIISSMFSHYANAKIRLFIKASDNDIRWISSHPQLRNIATMCVRKGLPKKKEVEDFLQLPCLKVNWKGDDEAVKDSVINDELLGYICAMYSQKGIPKKAEVEAYLKLSCLKKNWQGENEAVKDMPMDCELVKCISNMCRRKGFPKKKEIEEILQLPCLKVNWKGDDSVKDSVINAELLGYIGAMYGGKGIPKKAEVEAFLKLSCLKKNWQGENEAVKDMPIDCELVKCISIMCRRKGFPKKQEIEAFLKLSCLKDDWQGDDKSVKNNPIDMKRVKCIFSMCGRKGFPINGEVEAFLKMSCWKNGWQGDGSTVKDNSIDWKRIKIFSTICAQECFPKKGEIEAFIRLPCWKKGWQDNDSTVTDNSIDWERIKIFTTLCKGKDLPKKNEMEGILKLPCLKVGWKGDDEAVKDNAVDWKSVKIICRMCVKQGFPKKNEIEGILKLPCLKVGWQGDDEAVKDKSVNWDMVKIISSMCCEKGIPKNGEVEAFIRLSSLRKDWQGDDEVVKNNPIDRTRIIIIYMMCRSKGFPKKVEVESFFKLFCLKEGWNGDNEAVKDNPINLWWARCISSMCFQKGIPKEKEVDAFLKLSCLKMDWQGDDKAVKDKPVNWALVKIISSICSQRGIPKKAEVEALLRLPCWKKGWKGDDEDVKGMPIDWVLFKVILSMYCQKGMPKKSDLKSFLKLPCLKNDWQGDDESVKDNPINLQIVKIISIIYSRKSIPKKVEVEAFLKWIHSNELELYLKWSARIFYRQGFPTLLKQKEYRKELFKILKSHLDALGQSENECRQYEKINRLSLFCAGPEKWRLRVKQFKDFLMVCKKPILESLTLLQNILVHNGSAGLSLWLDYYDNINENNKEVISKILSKSAPLKLMTLALTTFSEDEWPDYIDFCWRLTSAPDKKQWQSLTLFRQKFDEEIKISLFRRDMFAILWPQSESDRLKYIDNVKKLFKIVPSISQLYRIHLEFGAEKMKLFLDACLTWQETLEGFYKLEAATLELLLEGLLIAKYYFYGFSCIPDLCFSSRTSDNGKGVEVDGCSNVRADERLRYFVIAMLIELEQTEYKYKNKKLTIITPKGNSIELPKPEFTLTSSGFAINNWSPEKLEEFLQATEFTKQWYNISKEKSEPCIRGSKTHLSDMNAEGQESDNTLNKRLRPKCISLHTIYSLIESKKPLKPRVWTAVENYLARDQLPLIICKPLDQFIKGSDEWVVPDIVKIYVTTKLQKELKETLVVQSIQPPQNNNEQVLTVDIMKDPQCALNDLLKQLDSVSVITELEFDLLKNYQHLMSYEQMLHVMLKFSQSIDEIEQLSWEIDLEEKKHIELQNSSMGLDFSEDTWSSIMEKDGGDLFGVGFLKDICDDTVIDE